MQDPSLLFVFAALGLAGLGIAGLAALKAWSEWLDLKRLELARGARGAGCDDLSEVRSRIRRLEAIARGAEA